VKWGVADIGQVEPEANPDRKGFYSFSVRAWAFALDLTYVFLHTTI
jgi:hypothetical protein